jgi:hypothetical protein
MIKFRGGGDGRGMWHYGKKINVYRAVVDRRGYKRSLKNLIPRWDDNIKGDFKNEKGGCDLDSSSLR